MNAQRAIQLDDAADAVTLHRSELEPCLTDDNGGDPDGSAWLMWDPEGTNLDETTLDAFRDAGIRCHLVDVFVTAYPPTGGVFASPDLPEQPWMGHQTIGQAAFLAQADAVACEDIMEGVTR